MQNSFQRVGVMVSVMAECDGEIKARFAR
jgi:hypothetical protein